MRPISIALALALLTTPCAAWDMHARPKTIGEILHDVCASFNPGTSHDPSISYKQPFIIADTDTGQYVLQCPEAKP